MQILFRNISTNISVCDVSEVQILKEVNHLVVPGIIVLRRRQSPFESQIVNSLQHRWSNFCCSCVSAGSFFVMVAVVWKCNHYCCSFVHILFYAQFSFPGQVYAEVMSLKFLQLPAQRIFPESFRFTLCKAKY